MDRKRKVAMIAATFFLAAATGQYMQSSAPPHRTPQVPHAIADATGKARSPVATDVRLLPPRSRPTPALPALRPVALALPADADAASTAIAAADPAPSCAPRLTLAPAPAAMLRLKLSAPCNASERVVIRSGALAFTALTSSTGGLELTVPAMQQQATVSVRFSGGAETAASIAVSDLARYSRVAVQWAGQNAFRLDALEFGARLGSTKAVSPEHPRAPGALRGGFLTVLGDTSAPLPMRAQVYTLPRTQAKGGKVSVLVEAPVGPTSCGRALRGQLLTAGDTASADNSADQMMAADVTVAMPACDLKENGQVVALPGLVPTLEVAAAR